MFPEKHAVLVVGEANTGLFEFCCYLGSTYLKNGEKVVFLENNTPPQLVRRQMATFGIDAPDHEEARSLVLIDAFKRMRKSDDNVIAVENTAVLPDIFDAVTAGIERLGGEGVRVIFDSLTPLYVSHEPADVWRFFKDLTTFCRSAGAMTAVVNKGILDEDQIAQVAGLADGILEMRMDSEFRRYVRIQHLKGTIVSPKWVPFEFEEEQEKEDVALLGWGAHGQEEE